MPDGSEYIYNWGQVNNTLNKLYQKEIAEGRYRQSAFDKANIELQKAQAGIRPQDIPSVTNHYNTWKNAEIALLNPKVRQNPELRQKFTEASDQAHTNYMAEVNDSKAFAKEFPSYKMKILEDKGHNYDMEQMPDWENTVNKMSTKEIRSAGLDMPVHLILGNDSHDPKKFQEAVLGKRVTKNFEIPGTTDPVTKMPVEYIQNAKEYGQYDDSEVARRAAHEIEGNRKLQRDAVREFQASDPGLVKETIETARELVRQHKHNGDIGAENSLHDNDPYSFKIAQAIIQNQPKDLGEVGRRPNHLHDTKLREIQHREDKAQQSYFQNENLKIAKQRLGLEYQKYSDKKNVDKADDLAITQMYEAAHKPDEEVTLPNGKKILGRHLVDNYVQTITSNNPAGIKGVVLSRADITDAKERDRLARKLDIDVANKFGGKLTEPEVKERMLDDFLFKVNEKYPNLKLTRESLSSKAVPIFIQDKNLPTEKFEGGKVIKTYTPMKVAVAADPSSNNLGEFGSIITQNNAKKKKSQADKEDDVFEELNNYAPVSSGSGKKAVKPSAKNYGL